MLLSTHAARDGTRHGPRRGAATGSSTRFQRVTNRSTVRTSSSFVEVDHRGKEELAVVLVLGLVSEQRDGPGGFGVRTRLFDDADHDPH